VVKAIFMLTAAKIF